MNFFKKIKFILIKIKVYLRYKKNIKTTIKWIFTGKEITNFTYKIKNENELIHAANLVTNLDYVGIQKIMDELNPTNKELKLFFTTHFFKEIKDTKKLGRRILWYILARVIKPNVIIESGVFNGLGTGLLIFALHKNSLEQPTNKFEYKGLDIKLNNLFYKEKNPSKVDVKLIEKDSHEFLKSYKDKNKLIYISDADHDYNFEIKEYELIQKNLAPGSLIISDTGTKSLSDFSMLNNKKLVCFSEKPDQHWYLGAKCSISYDF